MYLPPTTRPTAPKGLVYPAEDCTVVRNGTTVDELPISRLDGRWC